MCSHSVHASPYKLDQEVHVSPNKCDVFVQAKPDTLDAAIIAYSIKIHLTKYDSCRNRKGK